MKIARLGPVGQETPAALIHDRYLRLGAAVELSITGLGTQRQITAPGPATQTRR